MRLPCSLKKTYVGFLKWILEKVYVYAFSCRLEIKHRGFPRVVKVARAWMLQLLLSHVCRLPLGCERCRRTSELEVSGTSRAYSVRSAPRSGNAGKQIPHRSGHMQRRYPDTGRVDWDFTIPPSAAQSVDRGMLYKDSGAKAYGTYEPAIFNLGRQRPRLKIAASHTWSKLRVHGCDSRCSHMSVVCVWAVSDVVVPRSLDFFEKVRHVPLVARHGRLTLESKSPFPQATCRAGIRIPGGYIGISQSHHPHRCQ